MSKTEKSFSGKTDVYKRSISSEVQTSLSLLVRLKKVQGKKKDHAAAEEAARIQGASDAEKEGREGKRKLVDWYIYEL